MPNRLGPVLLWSVTTIVQRTNERAAGIVGINPRQVNDYFKWAMFTFKVTANNNLNPTIIIIYGALVNNAFPPPGDQTNVLCAPLIAAPPVLLANQGVSGVSGLPVYGGPGTVQNTIVPPFLLLEYTTAAAGAAPNLQFEVYGFFTS